MVIEGHAECSPQQRAGAPAARAVCAATPCSLEPSDRGCAVAGARSYTGDREPRAQRGPRTRVRRAGRSVRLRDCIRRIQAELVVSRQRVKDGPPVRACDVCFLLSRRDGPWTDHSTGCVIHGAVVATEPENRDRRSVHSHARVCRVDHQIQAPCRRRFDGEQRHDSDIALHLSRPSLPTIDSSPQGDDTGVVLRCAVARPSSVRFQSGSPTFAHACQRRRELRLAGHAEVVRRSLGGADRLGGGGPQIPPFHQHCRTAPRYLKSGAAAAVRLNRFPRRSDS